MEIYLTDLRKAINRIEEMDGNLRSYVSRIEGASDGIFFLFTNGDIYKYIIKADRVYKLKGDWR
jgi:hypothetical protein